jgi:hypothetical protein
MPYSETGSSSPRPPTLLEGLGMLGHDLQQRQQHIANSYI